AGGGDSWRVRRNWCGAGRGGESTADRDDPHGRPDVDWANRHDDDGATNGADASGRADYESESPQRLLTAGCAARPSRHPGMGTPAQRGRDCGEPRSISSYVTLIVYRQIWELVRIELINLVTSAGKVRGP